MVELLPEDWLEEALETERPDPERFAEGVRRRVEELESGAAGADTEDESDWPLWIRRAAAVLPPGVMECALLGKWSTAAKGVGAAKGASSSTSALGLMFAPWALVLVVVAALGVALAVTFRLRGEVSSDVIAQRRAAQDLDRSMRWIYPLSLAAFLSVPLMGWLSSSSFIYLFTAAMLIPSVSLVLVVRSLSARGLADRRSVARGVTGIALQIFCWGPGLLVFQDFAGPWTRALFGSLMTGAWFMVVALTPRGSSRVGRTLALGALAAWTVAWPWLATWVAGAPFAPDEERLREWVEQTDGIERRRLEAWTPLGHAVAVLGQDTVSLEPAREALAAWDPEQTEWRIRARSIWRAGLMSASELIGFDPEQDEWRRFENRLDDPDFEFRHHSDSVLEIVAAHEQGRLNGDRRAHLSAAFDAALPEAGSFSGVEDAWDLVEVAGAIGDEAFVERNEEGLHEILVEAWDADRGPYSVPGGFGNWFEADEDEPRRLHPNALATLVGVRVMAAAGVPDEIDLWKVRHFLWQEMLTSDPDRVLSDELEAAVGYIALESDLVLEEPSLWERIRGELPLIAGAILATIAVWVVWRAPVVEHGDAGSSAVGS